eukprot:TRINITY_DN12218_c0_g1_i1.p1 TRINITY_DN12218_c0_g1~~TRINITY_DN12218_c0_g1_i1.p1  ORF type:complete len:395 (-),score=69.54 TRINITY_DN12218_c0_g1_i1:122-1306(-)
MCTFPTPALDRLLLQSPRAVTAAARPDPFASSAASGDVPASSCTLPGRNSSGRSSRVSYREDVAHSRYVSPSSSSSVSSEFADGPFNSHSHRSVSRPSTSSNGRRRSSSSRTQSANSRNSTFTGRSFYQDPKEYLRTELADFSGGQLEVSGALVRSEGREHERPSSEAPYLSSGDDGDVFHDANGADPAEDEMLGLLREEVARRLAAEAELQKQQEKARALVSSLERLRHNDILRSRMQRRREQQQDEDKDGLVILTDTPSSTAVAETITLREGSRSEAEGEQLEQTDKQEMAAKAIDADVGVQHTRSSIMAEKVTQLQEELKKKENEVCRLQSKLLYLEKMSHAMAEHNLLVTEESRKRRREMKRNIHLLLTGAGLVGVVLAAMAVRNLSKSK